MTLVPGLYVIATPIGNLADITLRALDTLKSADLVLCEDTRVTAKLFAAHGVKTPLRPYHDHNAAEARPEILARLAGGAAIGLVSDAGTPLVSDPGYKLVRAARDAGVAVFTVPGASALLGALSIAGAPTDRFLFAGFPPSKPGQRAHWLEGLSTVAATLVFYETGPRLAASLAAMAAAFGDRKACVARELTKLHEETREGGLEHLATAYAEEPAPRGEIVIVVHPPQAAPAGEADIDSALEDALDALSVKDAAATVAAALGAPKRVVYARALALKNARTKSAES